MKFFLTLGLLTLATTATAEVFKLPMGTTFRAKADGFDCGTFGPEADYVVAPASFGEKEITFGQLSADKELNHFLIELSFPSETGANCTYGAFFIRNREAVRLDFDYSNLVSDVDASECASVSTWLDNNLTSLPYEASKRGFRYVAVSLVDNAPAELCESGVVRVVFDRR